MNIKNVLLELGLNNKEILVYLTLVKNGKTTPTNISKIAKINRATVYSVAKSLQNKGYIAEDIAGKKTTFYPIPPKDLKQVTQKELRELKNKESLLEKAMQELSMIASENSYPVPKIRFIEESNLENFLYERMPTWIESLEASDKTWWGTQDHTFSENFDEFGEWYWKQPYAKNIKMLLLSNNAEVERSLYRKHKRPERDVLFNGGMSFTSSVWVGGDYLVMIVTRQKPFYLFEIHDKTLAHNMREVFKNLWSAVKNRESTTYIPLQRPADGRA